MVRARATEFDMTHYGSPMMRCYEGINPSSVGNYAACAISLAESDSRAAAVLAYTFINPPAVDSPSPYTVSLPLH